MTTVVCCMSERKMYADSKSTTGTWKFRTPKIEQIKEGLIAAAGELKLTERLINFLKNGGEPPVFTEDEDVEAIALTPTGILFYTDCAFPVVVEEDVFAIGTGGSIVMGVLAHQRRLGMPRDILAAMEVALDVDDNSGPPIQVVELKKKKGKK